MKMLALYVTWNKSCGQCRRGICNDFPALKIHMWMHYAVDNRSINFNFISVNQGFAILCGLQKLQIYGSGVKLVVRSNIPRHLVVK